MQIRDWGIIIGQLMMFFEDRLHGKWLHSRGAAPGPLGVTALVFHGDNKKKAAPSRICRPAKPHAPLGSLPSVALSCA